MVIDVFVEEGSGRLQQWRLPRRQARCKSEALRHGSHSFRHVSEEAAVSLGEEEPARDPLGLRKVDEGCQETVVKGGLGLDGEPEGRQGLGSRATRSLLLVRLDFEDVADELARARRPDEHELEAGRVSVRDDVIQDLLGDSRVPRVRRGHVEQHRGEGHGAVRRVDEGSHLGRLLALEHAARGRRAQLQRLRARVAVLLARCE
mmetsp:Transcript_23363/g.49809  ORF Transcript_23363/g.49809 Transcript_23363/m.49809 type:complete len:204 (+) Transcript_23363:32-643(+)